MVFYYTEPLPPPKIKNKSRREKEKETTQVDGRQEEGVEGTCHVNSHNNSYKTLLCFARRGTVQRSQPQTPGFVCWSWFLYIKARVGRCAGHWDGAHRRACELIFVVLHTTWFFFYTLYNYLQWRGWQEIVAATAEKKPGGDTNST